MHTSKHLAAGGEGGMLSFFQPVSAVTPCVDKTPANVSSVGGVSYRLVPSNVRVLEDTTSNDWAMRMVHWIRAT